MSRRSVLVHIVTALALMTAPAVVPSNSPLHVLSVMGIGLVLLELRDWKRGLTRPLLYRENCTV